MSENAELLAKLAEHKSSGTVVPASTVSGENANPANVPGKTSAERQRISMSTPVQKLEVPPIPGFHLHWFRSWEPGRIQRAQRAGYEFVSWDEVELNNTDFGGESAASGNTDLGSGVSLVTGDGLDQSGQPARLVLMKIKEEFWLADQKIVAERNEKIASAIRDGGVGAGQGRENPADVTKRYTKDISKHLFTPKNRPPAGGA